MSNYTTRSVGYLPGRRTWRTLWLMRGPSRRVAYCTVHNENGSVLLAWFEEMQ
jgi:hypothetical protein